MNKHVTDHLELRSAIAKAITSFSHDISCDQIKLFRSNGLMDNLLTLLVDEVVKNVAALSSSVAPEQELARMTRMFHAACEDLGAISDELGIDSEIDGGADPIIEAIREMRATYMSSQPSAAHAEGLQVEIDRLTAIINTPHLNDFLQAVSIEAEHQRQRWGVNHDAGKLPGDWLFLVGNLGSRAVEYDKQGNTEKYLHHIITSAAACLNWHLSAQGKTNMRPGIDGEAALKTTAPSLGEE